MGAGLSTSTSMNGQLGLVSRLFWRVLGRNPASHLDEYQRFSRKAKVLVLGAEGAGKSTLLKQMRFVYGDSCSPEEVESYRQLVFRNITHGLRSVLFWMADLNLRVAAQNEHLVCILDDIPDLQVGQPFPPDYHDALERLWADPNVQAAYSRGNEGALPENLPYFFANMERLFDPSYVPSSQDILHVYEKTTGLTEQVFKTPIMDLHMVLVGDGMGSRRKWIHCFEDVVAVVFVASLSSYDRSSAEDRNINQMEEAMAVWGSICHSQWFKNTSVILYLNKKDSFEEKIRHSSIRDYFPDCDATAGDAKAGQEYFKKRFARLSQSENGKGREVYIHTTSAIHDPYLYRILVSAVEDIVLRWSLVSTAPDWSPESCFPWR